VHRILCLSLTLAYLMMPVQTAPAQQRRADEGRIPVRSDSRLWLEGSSNIRDWTCRATTLEATIEVDAPGPASGAEAVKGVAVRVPVQMLKCGDRHMEAQMYAALKSSTATPGFITAQVDRIPVGLIPGQVIQTEATINIAGVAKTVKISVTADVLPDGSRRARGTVPILMTDFGITPPHPWGGILRTADKVLIQFEIFVAPQT
jgi:polyisoprenoid-binding protein YceI